MSEEKRTEQDAPAASGEALSEETLEAVSGGLSLIGTTMPILGGGIRPSPTIPIEPLVEPIPIDPVSLILE